MNRLKRVTLQCFILINLITIGVHNVPRWVNEAAQKPFAELPEGLRNVLGRVRFAFFYYGYYVGLNNRWEMFAFAHRIDWHFLFEAVTEDGKRHVLPLPLQSERTLLQKNFLDFKEAKFHLNLYGDRPSQMAYVRYLCKNYSSLEGKKVTKISVQLESRSIYDREVALKAGVHHPPEWKKEIWGEVAC